jgi:hypothetical protein
MILTSIVVSTPHSLLGQPVPRDRPISGKRFLSGIRLLSRVASLCFDGPVYAEFRGDRATGAPLTWGQRAIWKAITEFTPHTSWLNLCRLLTVPRRAGADVASVTGAIGALMSRHESLRTRIEETGGERRQVTAASGRLPVAVVECADGGTDDGLSAAQEVLDRIGQPPYDYTGEWPVRAALVLVGGRVRHVALVFSHVAADFHATEILLRDLRLLLLRGTVTGPAGLQSVDVAAAERGAVRHRTYRALDHWLANYGRLPRSMFEAVAAPLVPRYRRALLVSPALDAAMRLIAGKHRVTTSTVLVAATAATIGAWTGHGTCGLFTMVNNRFQPGYRDAISKLNQIGMFALDLSDRPAFADLLPRAWQAALAAYQHAYYDPLVLDRALHEIGRPPGSGLEPYCYFNDLRLPGDTEAVGDLRDEADVRAALARTSLTWPETIDRFAWRFRLQVLDTPGGIGISVTVDSRYLPPDRAERFLLDLEDLVVTAAFR